MAFDFNKYKSPVSTPTTGQSTFDFSKYKDPGVPRTQPAQQSAPSLTPKQAPSFTDWASQQAGDTIGEGVMSLGSDIIGGAGKVLGGVANIGGGLLGGMGNMVQGRAPTDQQTAQMVSGMGQTLSGGAQAIFSPLTAGIKALPQSIQNPVEYGFGKLGEGVNYGLDMVPKTIGGAVSGVGYLAGQKGMQQVGQRISESIQSPEWAKVKEAALQLPAIGAMTRTLTKVPMRLQQLATMPGEKMFQGAAKAVKAGASALKTGGQELFSKAVLDKPIVKQLQKQAVKNKNITPALQGKLTIESVVPKALSTVDDIQKNADILRQNTVSYLKKLETDKVKAGKSPLLTPRIEKVDKLLNEFGIVRASKGIMAKGDDVTKTPLTQSQLKQFGEVIQGMNKKQMTPSEFWNVRSKIGDIVGQLERKGELSPKLKAFTDNLYHAWNEAGRNQIKGLAKRDIQLEKAITKLSPIKKLFYDKEGGILPNEQISQALQATAGKGRARFEELKNLEKVLPGIGKELKAIGLATQVEQKAGPLAGQYLRSFLQGGAGVSGVSGNYPAAIALGLTSLATSPQNVARAIVGTAKKSQQAKQFIQKNITPTASKVSSYIQKTQPWEIPGDVLKAVRAKLKK